MLPTVRFCTMLAMTRQGQLLRDHLSFQRNLFCLLPFSQTCPLFDWIKSGFLTWPMACDLLEQAAQAAFPHRHTNMAERKGLSAAPCHSKSPESQTL